MASHSGGTSGWNGHNVCDIVNQKENKTMSQEKVQPAIKSYFFGKGYRDLGNTIAESWQLNLETAKRFGAKFSEYWSEGGWHYFMAAGTGFAAFSVVVFGTLFFLGLSAIHIAVLGTVFLSIYISFTLILMLDKLYRVRNKIFTACPKCHHKSELPVYICPKCRAAHTHLIPNSYGIVKRTCNCGEKLPTSFMNGRSKLEAKCPHCEHGFEGKETTPVCIPIIGGPSVGKTCYLLAAAKTFREDIAPKKSWDTPFLNEQNEDMYNRAIRDFNDGVPPLKTSERTPTAFNFFIKNKKWAADKLLYFYDAAGEAFHDSSELLSHRFYGYLHGFIFIIDPFSIPELLAEYEDNLKIHGTGIKPSDKMLEDAFDIMLINLEKNHNIKKDQRINKPCAIVINKIDVFDLEDRIGHNAVKEYIKKHPDIQDFEEAEDRICKEMFKSWGLGNFLRKLEQKFKKYRFFTGSALGRIPDNSRAGFKPDRVIEPLTWVLGEADRNLRA
jgi:hypothetical protein